MTIRIASYASIVLSAASLAWGYARMGLDPLARWLVFFGVLWLFARSQRWWWFSALGFVFIVVVAALGMMFGMVPGWAIASGVFALVAWDLTEFHRRTRFESKKDEVREMARWHLRRATAVAVLGLFIASVMMFLIRSPFTREWVLLLVGISFLGLLQLVLWFRNRG